MIGMPRAKKARPPQAEPERSDISSAISAVGSKEEASPSGPMELALGTAESSDEAEDKEMQKEAAALTKAARKSVCEAAVDVRKAEAALRLHSGKCAAVVVHHTVGRRDETHDVCWSCWGGGSWVERNTKETLRGR